MKKTMLLAVLLLAAFWVLVPGTATGEVFPKHLTMSMKVSGNTIDGSQITRCGDSVEVENGTKMEWWMALGEAKRDPKGGWEEINNKIHCGFGSYGGPGGGSSDISHTPYLIGSISMLAAVSPNRMGTEKVFQMEISVTLRRLSGFSESGAPNYEESTEKRFFSIVEGGTVFLPLIKTDERKNDAFKQHEALIEIQARVGEKKDGAARYGTLLVSSDLEGAELLLDGGVVGRASSSEETVLRNVLVGDREVSARDSSGRVIVRIVRVEENRMTLIALNLPKPDYGATRYDLTFLGKNAQGYEEYRRESDAAVVVRIPPGEFLMGNLLAERQPSEHRVYVSEFMMDKTAVTWAQYKKFAQARGMPLPPGLPYWGVHDDHPAVFVTWEEAKAYCEWAGGRLPTEAEREKAARGTDNRMYPWGNEEPDPERAVYRRNWGELATDPVGVRPKGASPYGLLDMAGNVWEWCADWYDDKYYEVSPERDPRGPATGQAHVVRGGSWDSRPDVLNCSVRNWGYRGYREGDFGFRCAMDPVD